MLQYFFNNTAAGGVLVIKLNVLSWYTVITTGTVSYTHLELKHFKVCIPKKHILDIFRIYLQESEPHIRPLTVTVTSIDVYKRQGTTSSTSPRTRKLPLLKSSSLRTY